MAAQLSIGGTTVTFIEDTLDITYSLDERQRLQSDVIDYTGSLHFVKGEQVVLTDPVQGVMFNGYLNSDQEFPVYPAGAIRHTIDCIDQHYLADKRTYTHTYDSPQVAGKLVVDQLNTVLVPEGITQNFAQHYDTTANNFNQGILSGTVGLSNVGDGDLELSPSGSNMSFSERTTSDFSSGTLTNVTAASNTLAPTTSSAISLNAVLTLIVSSNYIYMNIWSGSMVVASNDTLHYEMWISSSNPELRAGIDLTFNDGSHMYDKSLTDTKGLGSSPDNSIGPASNAWYSRDIKLVGLNGKTISNVTVAIDGVATSGTYQVYFRNIYLASQSGSPFFSTTATATQVNPATVSQASGFSSVGAGVTVSVVQAWVSSQCSRLSPSRSISAVTLLGTSLVSYTATSLFQLYVSYDGGSSYQLCSNNAVLPALPAGSTVTGVSIQWKEVFTLSGADPTVTAGLSSLAITLNSAPLYSKTDLLKTYFTQSDWTTGSTLSHTTANSDGTLTLTAITRDWNDNAITSQTSFFDSGTTQSAASGAYSMTLAALGESKSRLDFVGSLQNFTLDVDITIDDTSQTGVVYRTTFWGTTHNSFAYLVALDSNRLQIGVGTNSNTNNYTPLATANPAVLQNITYHLTIIVQGNTHLVYFNYDTTPTLNITDSTYTASGNVGLRLFGTTNSTSSWDNLAIVQNFVGTWTSASISLSTVGTYGTSVVSWTEMNTNVSVGAVIIVQASVDGGTTYNLCTNGQAIPSLTKGQNVSSTSVKFKVTIGTTLGYKIPSISQLVCRVVGNYGTVSGTRSTVPLGNDTMLRSNVVGSWGTSFDSQSYTKVGTGTTNLTSNEGLITNTTGDVHMVLGSRTWTDEDGTVRFQLSASTITGGMELRYQDVNNFYRLAATTTTLSLIKKSTGTTTTIASTSISLSTGTFYWLRFRAVGNGPVNLYGRVWADGVIEKSTWDVTASV